MAKKVVILFTMLLLAASVWSDARPARQKVRKREGSYNVIVAGSFKGEGNATLNGNKFSVAVDVADAAGNKGAFVADNLTVDGNHFNGTGTAMGSQVIVRGRIDAPEFDAEKQLKLTRITATIASSDGKYARLVGSLPGSDKPVPPTVNPGGPRPPGGTGPKPPPRDPRVPRPPGNDDDDKGEHLRARGNLRRY